MSGRNLITNLPKYLKAITEHLQKCPSTRSPALPFILLFTNDLVRVDAPGIKYNKTKPNTLLIYMLPYLPLIASITSI